MYFLGVNIAQITVGDYKNVLVCPVNVTTLTGSLVVDVPDGYEIESVAMCDVQYCNRIVDYVDF